MLLRLVKRFGLIAFALYHVPFFLNNYPSLGGGGIGDGGLAITWGHVFTVPGLWIARHVFGVEGEMPSGASGDNGDVAEEYARLLLAVVIGLVAAAAWTWRDRDKPGAPWVDEALRVLLRYAIVLGLMSYAIGKLMPMQFPALDNASYEETLGEMRPMTVLWNAMRFARPYAFLGGVLEIVPILLLCFRRTATLGALLLVPVMFDVTMMNFCYGVPVKLFALMITVSAVVLVAYDARPLFELLVLHRRVEPPPLAEPFADGRWNRWRWIVKALAVGSVAVSSIVGFRAAMHAPLDGPFSGTWQATTGPWRRFAITERGIAIRADDFRLMRCRVKHPSADTISLACFDKRTGDLRWSVTGSEMHLTGSFDGAPLDATLTRAETPRLATAKFQWFFD